MSADLAKSKTAKLIQFYKSAKNSTRENKYIYSIWKLPETIWKLPGSGRDSLESGRDSLEIGRDHVETGDNQRLSGDGETLWIHYGEW